MRLCQVTSCCHPCLSVAVCALFGCGYFFSHVITDNLPTSPVEVWNEAGSDCRWNLNASSQPRLWLPNGSNLHVSLGLLVPAESQYVLLEKYDTILDMHRWRIYITLRTFPISFQHQKCIYVETVGLRSGPIGQHRGIRWTHMSSLCWLSNTNTAKGLANILCSINDIIWTCFPSTLVVTDGVSFGNLIYII